MVDTSTQVTTQAGRDRGARLSAKPSCGGRKEVNRVMAESSFQQPEKAVGKQSATTRLE